MPLKPWRPPFQPPFLAYWLRPWPATDVRGYVMELALFCSYLVIYLFLITFYGFVLIFEVYITF